MNQQTEPQQQQQQQPQHEHVVCRCCLLENPPLHYNIYVMPDLCGELSECMPQLRYEPHDGLSAAICEQCWWQLRETNAFRRRCLYADQELRRRNDEATRAIEEALDLMDDLLQEQCRSQAAATASQHEATATATTNMDMSLLNELLLEECTAAAELPPLGANSSNELLNDVFDVLGNACPAWDSLAAFSFDGLTELTAAATPDIHAPQAPASITPTPHVQPPPTQKPKKSTAAQHACPECDKTFTRNFQLKLHLISVHNIGDGLQYPCGECDKTFASRHSLNYHQKSIHSTERPYGCDQCARRFILRTQLVSHQRTHTGVPKARTHPCADCDKHFLTKSDLRTHFTRSHCRDAKRPYKCDYCAKCFFTRSHLGSHLLVHTGEKPFVCVFCAKSYQGVGNLNNHLARRHGDSLLAGGTGTVLAHPIAV